MTKVNVGVSNRHVHLCKEDLEILFGEGFQLEPDRDLTQKGEFAAKQKVTIKTDFSEISNVRVLGPIRDYTQVEISRTDAYKLKLNPPVRDSGDLDKSEKISIVGPLGEIEKKSNCILATRHIHASLEDIKKYGLDPSKTYQVKVAGEKGGIFDNVRIKVKDTYTFELHIDTDDANAFLIKSGDVLEIVND